MNYIIRVYVEVIDLPTARRAKKEGLQANESSYRAD